LTINCVDGDSDYGRELRFTKINKVT